MAYLAKNRNLMLEIILKKNGLEKENPNFPIILSAIVSKIK